MHTKLSRAGTLLCLGLCLALAGCDLLQPATPGPSPAPAATLEPPATAQPATLIGYIGTSLPLAIAYPEGWLANEAGGRLVLATGPDALAGAELEGPALVVSRVEGAASPEETLASVNLQGAEVLRQGSAMLGGEVGSMVEATLVSPTSGRGYRILLVAAVHDGQGYLVTASAPLEMWEAAEANLQSVIESVAFR